MQNASDECCDFWFTLPLVMLFCADFHLVYFATACSPLLELLLLDAFDKSAKTLN